MDNKIDETQTALARYEAIFSHLQEQDIEQFYAQYQLWVLYHRLPILEKQVETLREHIVENQSLIQTLRPSAIAQAVLVRLQSKGVEDVVLLDQMLERGEEWLDRMMQRLDYCEQVEDFIQGDYTQWCANSLEGAYDWIDSLRGSPQTETEVFPERSTPDAQATAELLLQKLKTDDEEAMREVTLPPAPPVSPPDDQPQNESPAETEENVQLDESLTVDVAEENVQLDEESEESAHFEEPPVVDVAEAEESAQLEEARSTPEESLAIDPMPTFDQPGSMNEWIKVLQADTLARIEAGETEVAEYNLAEIILPESEEAPTNAEPAINEEVPTNGELTGIEENISTSVELAITTEEDTSASAESEETAGAGTESEAEQLLIAIEETSDEITEQNATTEETSDEITEQDATVEEALSVSVEENPLAPAEVETEMIDEIAGEVEVEAIDESSVEIEATDVAEAVIPVEAGPVSEEQTDTLAEEAVVAEQTLVSPETLSPASEQEIAVVESDIETMAPVSEEQVSEEVAQEVVLSDEKVSEGATKKAVLPEEEDTVEMLSVSAEEHEIEEAGIANSLLSTEEEKGEQPWYEYLEIETINSPAQSEVKEIEGWETWPADSEDEQTLDDRTLPLVLKDIALARAHQATTGAEEEMEGESEHIDEVLVRRVVVEQANVPAPTRLEEVMNLKIEQTSTSRGSSEEASSQPEKPRKRGFWARLFGRKRKS